MSAISLSTVPLTGQTRNVKPLYPAATISAVKKPAAKKAAPTSTKKAPVVRVKRATAQKKAATAPNTAVTANATEAEVPDTAQYVRALTVLEKDISVNDRELLLAHWSFPEHAATASELANATGFKYYGAVNLRYGRLGKFLRQELNYTKPGVLSGVISWFERRNTDGQWIFHMHPEVAAALEHLHWVKVATGL